MVSKKTIKTFLIVIVTAAATAILLSPWLAKDRFKNIKNVKQTTIDTVIKRDTIIDVDTFNVPHTVLVPSKTDTIYQEKIPRDTVLNTISKTYDIDNDSVGAHVVISGVNPRLDSMSIWAKKTSYTVNRTITKTIPINDTKRFKIYPTIGVGYGVFSRKPDMYIGIGLTYNFN